MILSLSSCVVSFFVLSWKTKTQSPPRQQTMNNSQLWEHRNTLSKEDVFHWTYKNRASILKGSGGTMMKRGIPLKADLTCGVGTDSMWEGRRKMTLRWYATVLTEPSLGDVMAAVTTVYALPLPASPGADVWDTLTLQQQETHCFAFVYKINSFSSVICSTAHGKRCPARCQDSSWYGAERMRSPRNETYFSGSQQCHSQPQGKSLKYGLVSLHGFP